jgi:hypothetical protein
MRADRRYERMNIAGLGSDDFLVHVAVRDTESVLL